METVNARLRSKRSNDPYFYKKEEHLDLQMGLKYANIEYSIEEQIF